MTVSSTGLLLASVALSVAAVTVNNNFRITGSYACQGACARADSTTFQVNGEVDTVYLISGSENLYRVQIEGQGGFYETEIGALSVSGVLRTATSNVSDSIYPVLEEYEFYNIVALPNGQQQANSFQKTVRGPDHGAFKACSVTCNRMADGYDEL